MFRAQHLWQPHYHNLIITNCPNVLHHFLYIVWIVCFVIWISSYRTCCFIGTFVKLPACVALFYPMCFVLHLLFIFLSKYLSMWVYILSPLLTLQCYIFSINLYFMWHHSTTRGNSPLIDNAKKNDSILKNSWTQTIYFCQWVIKDWIWTRT